MPRQPATTKRGTEHGDRYRPLPCKSIDVTWAQHHGQGWAVNTPNNHGFVTERIMLHLGHAVLTVRHPPKDGEPAAIKTHVLNLGNALSYAYESDNR